MKKLLNVLFGYVIVRGEGAFPERLLNLCGQHRLAFWELRWLDETSVSFRVRWSEVKRLSELSERAMCVLTVEGLRGGLPFLLGLRRRWGFAAGMSMVLLAVMVLSRFVLVVEVTGNRQVPTALILSELHRQGVRPGVYGPGLARQEIANRTLIALPQLSFMALNLHGTRIEVIVREADPKPELLDERTAADIVAGTDGILVDIQTTAGRQLVEDGDTVARGDVLITGDMDLYEPEGSSYDQGRLMVRATGRVLARTWRVLEACVPLTKQEKRYTGAERKWHTLKFLWLHMDFYQNSGISYEKYDKITDTIPLTLWGYTLPVAWVTTTCREYRTEPAELERAAAEELLRQQLESRLEQMLSQSEGTVLRTDFVAEQREGLLYLTMLAECEEQIGVTVERKDPIGHIPGTGNHTTEESE